MGQQQSNDDHNGEQQRKDKLIYQHVPNGNIERIRSLRGKGAGLEYLDEEGKTPLIVACMSLSLYNVAKTLIELGANVNANSPGPDGGTPLHHAVKLASENTVKLLLSYGANALLKNDDRQTPLEVARAKGFTNIVRTIESRICLYSGWMREHYRTTFLEFLPEGFFSRKVWVVVLPYDSTYILNPRRLELALYTTTRDALPHTNIDFSIASIEEPNFDEAHPTVLISGSSIKFGNDEARVKLALVDVNDKEPLRQFCSACKGNPQVMLSNFPFNITTSMAMTSALGAPSTAPLAPSAPVDPNPNVAPEEDLESRQLIMAINASIQTAMEEGVPLGYIGETAGGASSSVNYQNAPAPDYGGSKYESPPCVICFDAPVEGVCVPCGHMVGCMSCLNEIKEREMGCPVCRAHIDLLIKVYTG